MTPYSRQRHFDPETNTWIEDEWYKVQQGGWYRQLSRPSGLPETKLWKRLTAQLETP